MRMSTRIKDTTPTIAGSLLIGASGLSDGNFAARLCSFPPHHGRRPLGIIVNRRWNAIGAKCREIAYGPLAGVPLYSGGPVATGANAALGWQWNAETGVFRLHFGISAKKAAELLKRPDTEVRGSRLRGWTATTRRPIEHKPGSTRRLTVRIFPKWKEKSL